MNISFLGDRCQWGELRREISERFPWRRKQKKLSIDCVEVTAVRKRGSRHIKHWELQEDRNLVRRFGAYERTKQNHIVWELYLKAGCYNQRVLFHETSSPLVTLDSAACTPVRIFILPEGGTCVYAHGRERSNKWIFRFRGRGCMVTLNLEVRILRQSQHE
jgi:hypothetical protein